jgi:pyruvate dehydrogenase E2 component (dihydrolipoyllysine-residue acetyltransferase)
MNAQWNEKTGEIIFPGDVAIGIAVDTEAGLMVPVIRGAAGLGLREIATRSRELIQSANERRLIPEDLQGGTFTITNLGAFGIETFTPMINLPECAILGLGRISRRPVMDGEKVVGRELMFLSLTFDHRIVDGAPAARFLQHLGRFIETPGPSLIS